MARDVIVTSIIRDDFLGNDGRQKYTLRFIGTGTGFPTNNATEVVSISFQDPVLNSNFSSADATIQTGNGSITFDQKTAPLDVIDFRGSTFEAGTVIKYQGVFYAAEYASFFELTDLKTGPAITTGTVIQPDPVLSIRDLIIARNGKYRIRGSAQHIVSGQRLRVIFLTHGTGGNVVSNFFIPFTETGDHDFQFTGDIPRSGTLAALLGGTPKSYTNVSMYVVAADATSELSNLYFDNTVHPLIHGTIPKPVINITEFTVTTAGKYRVRGIVNNVLSGERLRIIVGTRGSAGTLVVFNFFVPFTKKFDYEFAFDGDLPRGNRTLTDIFGDISTSYYTNVSLYVVSATGTTELSNLYFDNTQHSLHTAFPEIQITTLQGNPFVRVNVSGSTNRFASGTTSTTLDIEFGNIPSEYCDIELTATKIAGAGTVTNPNRTYPIANHSPNGTISLTINNSGDLAYSVAVNLKARNADQNSADVWCSDAIDVVIGTTNIANLRNDHLMQISSPKMWRQIEHNGETVNLEYALKDLTTGKPSTTLGPAVYALQVVLPSNNVYPVDFKGFLPTATTIDTAFLGKRIINANSRSRFLGNGHNLQDLPAGDYLILLRMATNTQLEGQGDLTLTNPNSLFNANRRWKAVPVPNGFNSVTYGQAGTMLRVLPTTKPTITISGLINGQQINRLQAATVNVSATSVSADNVAIIPVWSDITDPENPKAAVLMNIQNLAVGNYVYEVKATDVNKEVSIRTIQFTITPNTAGPILNITSPSPKLFRKGGSAVPIAATATDAIDGNIASKIVWSDITDPENPKVIPASAFTNIRTLDGGVYTFQATVTDTQNNTATKKVTFTIVDTLIEILTPVADDSYVHDTFNLQLTAKITINGTEYNIDQANALQDYTVLVQDITNSNNPLTRTKTQYQTLELLTAGTYTYQITVSRSRPNVVKTATVTFTIEAIPDGITFYYDPPENSLTPPLTLPRSIAWTGVPNPDVTFEESSLDKWTFLNAWYRYKPFGRAFGAWRDLFSYELSNASSGRSAHETNGSVPSRQNITIRDTQVTALGDYEIQLSVVQVYDVDYESSFLFDQDDVPSQSNDDIKILLNTVFNFRLGTDEADTTPPVITIVSPTPNQRIDKSGSAVNALATALDNSETTVKLTWQDITDSQNIKPAVVNDLQNLPIGNYRYRVTATDINNNSATKNIRFEVFRTKDTIIPTLTLTPPLTTDSTFEAGSEITLAATSTDNTDGNISSKVIFTNVDTGVTYANGSKIMLNAGTHNFKATVTDTAGNTNELTILIKSVGSDQTTIRRVWFIKFMLGETTTFTDSDIIQRINIDKVTADALVSEDHINRPWSRHALVILGDLISATILRNATILDNSNQTLAIARLQQTYKELALFLNQSSPLQDTTTIDIIPIERDSEGTFS